MALKFTDRRADPIARAKVVAMGNPLFSEKDWRESVSNGTVDLYTSVMQKSKNINPDDFYKKYNLYFGDTNNRLTALYNEVGVDRNTVKEFDKPVFDDNGNYLYDENGKQVFEKVQMTEYEYNKENIKIANSLYSQKNIINTQYQQRENRNEFVKFLSDIGVVSFKGANAFLSGLESIGAFVGGTLEEVGETLWQAAKLPFLPNEYKKLEYLTGEETYAETLNKWFTDKSINDDTDELINEFAYNTSHFYTDDGEETTMGKYILATVDTIGRMIPSMLLGYGIGSIGSGITSTAGIAGSKTGSFLTSQAGTIGQLSFYAGNVFGETVSDQYEYYASQGISVSSSEIVSNALVKTILQYGVEKGLGAIMGGTGLDEMFWGTSTKTNPLRFSNKNLTLKAFSRLGKDMLQEGLEESLQETSDWFVDAAHHFINHDFQSTEWNWQNIFDAFIVASLTSVVGASSKIIGSSVNRDVKLVKNKNGEYEFVKLNPIAAYEYGLNMQSYVENMENLEKANAKLIQLRREGNVDENLLKKASEQYSAAYYQAVGSFEILSDLYGEMGQERFAKANEILTKIQKAQDDGVLNDEIRREAQRNIIEALPSLTAASKKLIEAKLKEAEITKQEKSIKKGQITETNDNLSEKANKLIAELEDVNEVIITEDGKMPVKIERLLFIPKNLLNNANERVVMASIVEQELADELAKGVLTKAKYLNDELYLITDLYRQWSGDENSTEQEAIYNLIFDTRFFEVVLAVNEKITSSFVLRLNKLVNMVSKKQNLKNDLLNKRISECKERWINAAYNFYTNNLEKDTTDFTNGLTANERKSFNKRIDKHLALYNYGLEIIKSPNAVKPEVWEFIERRINNMTVDENVKNELKSNIKNENAATRQSAMDTVNEYYDGAFYTLYDGKTYMPENSVGNCAVNNWLKQMGLTLKTLFNSDYITNDERVEYGDLSELQDIYAMRQLQFNNLYKNMGLNISQEGNIVVDVNGIETGFEVYAKFYNREMSKVVKGESKVTPAITTDLVTASNWVKNLLKPELVKDGVHEFLTVDDLVNHSEYLSPAVVESILNDYNELNKISIYRYLQKSLTAHTDGKKSLLLKQDGSAVIGNMNSMNSILVKEPKYPRGGTFSIKNFIKSKYLTGVLGNIDVVFTNSGDTHYVDYSYDENGVIRLVNKIYINISTYKTNEEISFALCHEFAHAIQSENKLNLGTGKILKYFNEKDKNEIINIVKELEPKLFTNLKNKKEIETQVDNYIYSATGEFQANGFGGYGEIGFYPIIVTHNKGKTKITFQNGKSFEVPKMKNPIVVIRNIVDQSRETIKIYDKYSFSPSIGMADIRQTTRLRELANKKIVDMTQDEMIEFMYCRLKFNGSFDEFKNSQIIGIEIDGERYILGNSAYLESVVSQIATRKDYKEDKVNLKIFTFSPKDVNLYKPTLGTITGGKIIVNNGKLSNRRNIQIDLTKKAEVVSEQSLLIESISTVTSERVYNTNELIDVDETLYSLIKDYENYNVESYGEVIDPLSIPFNREIDIEELPVELNKAVDSWFIGVNEWIMSNDIAYKYFKEGLNKYEGKLVGVTQITKEDRQTLLNEWNNSVLKKTHLANIYSIFKHFYDFSYEEFLNFEIPVISLRNDLRGNPFVSASYLLSNDLTNANILFALSSQINDENQIVNLYLGKCKIKDIYMFVPNGMNEVLISEDSFSEVIPVSKSIGYDGTFDYGYHLNTRLNISGQELAKPTEFKGVDKKEKAPTAPTKTADTTEAEIKANKIIDKRPKSERKNSFKPNSKKYVHSRTPIVNSKYPTRIVSKNDIEQEIKESGKSFRRPRGGDYVYREFVERRYFMTSDGNENYEDIFDYYSERKSGDYGRRHTLVDETKDTNLKYVTTEKGKRQVTLNPGIRDIYKASTGLKLDPIIMNKIKSGTLKSKDLLDYIVLNDAKNIDNTTFHLICKYYLKNDLFKSPQELDTIVYQLGPKAMALNLLLRNNNDLKKFLKEEVTFENVNRIYDILSSDAKLAKELSQIEEGYLYAGSLKRFSKDKPSEQIDSDLYFKLVKDLLLDNYDGTIESVGKTMAVARDRYKHATNPNESLRWQTRFTYKVKETSFGKSIAEGKDGDKLSLEETMGENDTFFSTVDMTEYDTMLRELSDATTSIGRKVFTEIATNILNSTAENKPILAQKAITRYKTNIDKLSVEQVYNLYQSLLNDLDEDTLAKIYYLAGISDNSESFLTDNDYTRENKFKEKADKVVNTGGKVQSIKNQIKTIRKYVSKPSEIKILLEENSDIFNNDLTIKESAYKTKEGYKAYDDILSLKERINTISKNARNGVYESKSNYAAYTKRLERNQKTLNEILKYAKKSQGKIKYVATSIPTDDGSIEINIKKDTEIPSAIKEILSVGLTKTGRSKIQELSEYHERYNEDGSVDKVYDDKYLKLTMTHLLRESSDTLNGMSEDEAIEILEFYVSNNVILADVDSQLVQETVRLTCAYILGEVRNPQEGYSEDFARFNIDEALIKRVEAKMMEQAHMTATMLSNQRTIIRLLQPHKIIAQELARNLGFKLDAEDEANLDDMLTYMRTGKQKEYEKAKEAFESKLIRDYPEKSKQDAVDKLLTFERAMMLSNPGTWVRNIASNYIVEGGNITSYKTGKAVTDLFMKLFPKTKGKLETNEGYKLDKKASDDTVKFIDEKFINNGLLDDTIAGVSKYDDLSKRESSSDSIVDMIARSIHANIRRTQVFKNNKVGKVGNKVIGLIYKAINDDPWIKRTTKRYLGQIIEEDYQKAKKVAEKKGKSLTYEQYLADDETNMYGLSKNIMSAFVKAVDLASYDYMKTSNFITQMERAIRENVPKGAWFIYKQVFPFLSSSWNWCVEGMRYTPAGLASAIVKLARLEHTVQVMDNARSKGKSVVSGEFAKYLQIRNIGKGTIGTLTLAIGLLLAGLGWAGIDEEDDEYKLFVGDIKVNINDVLGTQGVMLGIAVGQNIANDGKDIVDVFAEAFNQLFRDSIFQDFIDTFRYDTGFGDFMWTTMWDIPTQFWPNILKTLASIVHHRGVEYSDDETVKQLQRLFVGNLPLPEQCVGANTKINPYTGQAESFFSGEFFADTFSRYLPVKVSYPSVDENEAKSIGLGIKKSQLTGNYTVNNEKVQLNSNERTKLNVLYGKLNKTQLTKFYNNSVKYRVQTENGTYKELSYSQMTDEQKKAVVNNLMSNNSSLSKIYILTSTGKYKYYTSDSEYEELRKLGIVKNIYKKTDKKSGFIKI